VIRGVGMERKGRGKKEDKWEGREEEGKRGEKNKSKCNALACRAA
jgi:hypothetical protein